MRRIACIPTALLLMTVTLSQGAGWTPRTASSAATGPYLGFDRNDYPGDQHLAALGQTFSYTSFWLNNPPGEQTNNWTGKREMLESAGFGFLVLFNGRPYAELKEVANAIKVGKSDAQAAVTSARQEGFPSATLIFLDQEEGGRMLPEQKAYIYSWVDGVTDAGFRAGIYCSGMAAKEGRGVRVITAEDVRENAGARKIFYWVTNDACPPSPGCIFLLRPAVPADSGIPFADIWQFAQSPKRRDVAASCAGYNSDGNCYPPGIEVGKRLQVDVNTATSADPSGGRSH